MHTASYAAHGAFTDSFVQFIMVFNVIGVFQIELFGVQFNFVTGRHFEFVFLFYQLLKVLSRKLHDVFRACAHYFLNVVFKDAWECIGHFDLLSGENALVVNV